MACVTSTSVAINRTRVRDNTTTICGVMTNMMAIDEKPVTKFGGSASPPVAAITLTLRCHQVGCKSRQVVMTVRPSILDRDILTLDITGLAQALAERTHTVRVSLRRCGTEKPNHRHRRLLRARREWPRGRRAAEQRDEFAAPHSITSSAVCRNGSGTVRPSAFAVLRLMTSSYLVGCWTGRSLALAPLRIRST